MGRRCGAVVINHRVGRSGRAARDPLTRRPAGRGTTRASGAARTRRARHNVWLARAGQCPFCAGTTTVDLRLEAVADGPHSIELSCDTCTFLVGVDPLSPLLLDERVADALAAAGVDGERVDWELPAPTTRVESRDPARIALEVDGNSGTATIVIDEAFAVRSVDVDR